MGARLLKGYSVAASVMPGGEAACPGDVDVDIDKNLDENVDEHVDVEVVHIVHHHVNVKDKVEEFMEKASYQERFSMRRELFNKDASLCIMAGPMVAWRVNLTDSLYTSYGRRGDGTFGVIDLAEQEMIDAASDEEVLLPTEPPSPPYVAVTAPPPPSTL